MHMPQSCSPLTQVLVPDKLVISGFLNRGGGIISDMIEVDDGVRGRPWPWLCVIRYVLGVGNEWTSGKLTCV